MGEGHLVLGSKMEGGVVCLGEWVGWQFVWDVNKCSTTKGGGELLVNFAYKSPHKHFKGKLI